jgi:hypothetical protein
MQAVAAAAVTLAQVVRVARAGVVRAVATHQLSEQPVRLTWAVEAVVVAQTAQAAVRLLRVALAARALQSCKSKHRCTPAP